MRLNEDLREEDWNSLYEEDSAGNLENEKSSLNRCYIWAGCNRLRCLLSIMTVVLTAIIIMIMVVSPPQQVCVPETQIIELNRYMRT